MRALALASLLLSVPLAQAESEATLRQRCTEQERQITALETQIEALHSQLALERRRSRGSTEPVTAPTPAPATATLTDYKVQAGDTLSTIARRNKTTSEKLMEINGIKDPTRLRIGQIIKVTGTVAATPAPAPAPVAKKKTPSVPAPATKKPETYVVQKGDTFYKVAQLHAISTSQLEALNPGVSPGRITVGQILGVAGEPRKPIAAAPAPKSSGYTQLISTKEEPKPAPAVKAPAPAAKAPAPATKEEPKPAPSTFSSIIVMDQISFGDFAAKHHTTPEQLNALNGLSLKASTVLAKGSELYVPSR